MSKSTRVLMILAMALAVYLMVALAGGYLRDAETLRKTEAELAESRAVWEGIAEEKEALQEELKAATEDLKEARLTLSESETRAAELEEENETLRGEIAALKEKVKDQDRTDSSETEEPAAEENGANSP